MVIALRHDWVGSESVSASTGRGASVGVLDQLLWSFGLSGQDGVEHYELV
jgi:hypothetical protein